MPTHDSGQTRPQRQHDDIEDAEASIAQDTDVAERHEKLSEDVDAILDEIDDVLETNAEEFVRSFVQKGGE
jgi:ubiquitin-like protein Pup